MLAKANQKSLNAYFHGLLRLCRLPSYILSSRGKYSDSSIFHIPFAETDLLALHTEGRKLLALFCQSTTQRLEDIESRDRYLAITPHSIFAALPPMGTLPNSPQRVGHCQATRRVHWLEPAPLLACLAARLCFVLGSCAPVE